jgi:hypothetical protein
MYDESDEHSHDDLSFNAIKVTTSLINDNDNAPTLNLMRLRGFGINLEATAIAAITSVPDIQCLKDGFVALGKIKIGDDNIVTGTSACFYASAGITLHSNSCFGSDHNEPEVFFGTPAGAEDIQYANNNIVAGTADDCINGSSGGESIASAFHPLDIKEVFASPETFIFDLNGTTTPKESIATLFELNLDNKTTAFPSGLNSPDSYNGKQTLGSLDNAIVFVRGDIDFSSGASITNSYIMATGNVSLPYGAQIGSSSQCDEDEGDQTVFIMAAQKIQAAANISAYGAQFISGEDTSFTAGGNVGGGLSVISGANIDLTSNWTLTGCEDTNQFRKFDEDEVSGKSILVF